MTGFQTSPLIKKRDLSCFIDFCLFVTRQHHGCYSRRSAFMILGWGSLILRCQGGRELAEEEEEPTLFLSVAVGTGAVEESRLGTRAPALINTKLIEMGS